MLYFDDPGTRKSEKKREDDPLLVSENFTFEYATMKERCQAGGQLERLRRYGEENHWDGRKTGGTRFARHAKMQKKTVRPVRSRKLLLRTDGKIHGYTVYSVLSFGIAREVLLESGEWPYPW